MCLDYSDPYNSQSHEMHYVRNDNFMVVSMTIIVEWFREENVPYYTSVPPLPKLSGRRIVNLPTAVADPAAFGQANAF